jgi:hypothetical protein
VVKRHWPGCAAVEFWKSDADSIRWSVIGKNEDALNLRRTFGHEYSSGHMFGDHRNARMLVHQLDGATDACDPAIVTARDGGTKRARDYEDISHHLVTPVK